MIKSFMSKFEDFVQHLERKNLMNAVAFVALVYLVIVFISVMAIVHLFIIGVGLPILVISVLAAVSYYTYQFILFYKEQ